MRIAINGIIAPENRLGAIRPGEEANFACSEGVFSFDGYDITTAIFQETLFKEWECDKYSPFILGKEEHINEKETFYKETGKEIS